MVFLMTNPTLVHRLRQLSQAGHLPAFVCALLDEAALHLERLSEERAELERRCAQQLEVIGQLTETHTGTTYCTPEEAEQVFEAARGAGLGEVGR